MKFSKKIESCGLSPIRKFTPYADAARARGVRIIPLNIGQPDVETPTEFFEAVRKFSTPVLEYAPSAGIPEYINAVRGYYAGIGTKLEAQDILATTGGSEALQMALQCILDEGDEVLTPEPFYTNYNTFVSLAGGVIRPIPTTPEEGFRFADRERIEPLINERTRAILVTNPGNPTGTVCSREELKMMVELACEHDLYFICDEVYREFIYNDEPMTTVLAFEGAEENVVVVDSVSKRFSACGARVGALISRNKELMNHAMKVCQGRLCGATIDQLGAAAMYGVGAEYYTAVREEYKARRDAVMGRLLEIPGVVCRYPEGAFYIMVKLPIDNADRFQQWLLEEFSVDGETLMFAPGEGFYATEGKGRDEVRMAYVIKSEELVRAMDILAIALEKYNAK